LNEIFVEDLADAEGKLRAVEAVLSFRRRVVEARHHKRKVLNWRSAERSRMGRMESEGGVTSCFGDIFPLQSLSRVNSTALRCVD
jgi:hypothetical protein